MPCRKALAGKRKLEFPIGCVLLRKAMLAQMADKRVVTGETAKHGDNSLELHEFFECLVMLGLEKANPTLGQAWPRSQPIGPRTGWKPPLLTAPSPLARAAQVGHNATVEFPLPGCLDTLLRGSILKKAKADDLAKVLKRVQKEPEVQAVLSASRPRLLKLFSTKASTAGPKSPSIMQMTALVSQLQSRNVIKDIIVHPTPAVQGAPSLEVPPPPATGACAHDPCLAIEAPRVCSLTHGPSRTLRRCTPTSRISTSRARSSRRRRATATARRASSQSSSTHSACAATSSTRRSRR